MDLLELDDELTTIWADQQEDVTMDSNVSYADILKINDTNNENNEVEDDDAKSTSNIEVSHVKSNTTNNPHKRNRKFRTSRRKPITSKKPLQLVSRNNMPHFEPNLADPRPLHELQANEIFNDSISTVETIDVAAAAGGYRQFTMLLVTHCEPRLGYSYESMDVSERDLIGISLYTYKFNLRNQKTEQINGLIFRRNYDMYIPYKQYQEQLNHLIYTDKFYNQRNLSKLRNHVITNNPNIAIANTVSTAPTVYSICHVPHTEHMLSYTFPIIHSYLREHNVSRFAHRLHPKLAWIVDAFTHYSVNNNSGLKNAQPIIGMKIDVSMRSVFICADCVKRENHNSSMCDTCLFHGYRKIVTEKCI